MTHSSARGPTRRPLPRLTVAGALLAVLLGPSACTAPADGEGEDVELTDDKGDGPVGAGSATINNCVNYCPDLSIDQARLIRSVVVETRDYAEGNCSVEEATVGAVGRRRLLRFDTSAVNRGKGDLLLGNPAAASRQRFFEFAPCHGHYHFTSFAKYELLAADGSVALQGRKQAFCIEDNQNVLGVVNPALKTTCQRQGLHRGWADTYTNHTEANWLDITDLAPGTYTLVVKLNEQHVIKETRYDNNEARAVVVVAANETPEACPADTEALYRCASNGEQRVRCYSGIKDVQTCSTPCTQPDEVSHQASCTTVATCPSDMSSTPVCGTSYDADRQETRPVATWCDKGLMRTKFCASRCDTSLGVGVCR